MKRLMAIVCSVMVCLVFRLSFAGEVVEVPVADIHPTQPTVGFAASEASQSFKFKNVKDESSLRERVLKEKPLRGVRGPDGAIYLTDGHHRSLAVFRTAAAICESSHSRDEVKACINGVHVHIALDADYTGRSWKEFADALFAENNIYLPPATRAKLASGELKREEIFQKPGSVLPATIADVTNDPMRSAIGTLFYYQGVDGNNFANYLEFLVAEKLGNKVEVKAGREFDPGVQIRLMKAIFGSATMVKYIRCLARPEEEAWNAAQKEIDEAIGLDASSSFSREACSAESR